jgi:hypothetical protein
MLIADHDGDLTEAFPHLGAVRVEAPSPRRRVRATLARRRPRILMRRKPGRLPPMPAVHREREIIARN